MGFDSKTGPWPARLARSFTLAAGDLSGLNALCRRRGRGGVRVLNYHGVLEAPLPGSIWTQLDAGVFRRQMAYLASHYEVVPASRVDWRDASGRNRVVITFDDGLANNLHVAAPILEELSLAATCFVAPGLIGERPGSAIWADRLYDIFLNPEVREIDLERWGLGRVALPDLADDRVGVLDSARQRIKALSDIQRRELVDAVVARYPARVPPELSAFRLLTREELKRLADSPAFEIGLHSHTHPIMSRLDASQQEREIDRAIHTLREWGIPWAPVFAYPNGKPEDFDGHTIDALQGHGIEVAMTTENGHYDPECGDPMRIQRIMIGDDATWWEFKAALSGYHYCLKRMTHRIRDLF